MASAAVRPQQHQIQWLPLSWTLGFMTAYLGIVLFIAENVPENYMDEPFHVPMTQLYCKGDFFSWDAKITTFPGLYVIGAAYAWATKLALSWAGLDLDVSCSGPYLRSMNALLAVATLQLAYAISMELQQTKSRSSSRSSSGASSTQQLQQWRDGAAGVALIVGLLPTQLFFAFLFYTDVSSLLFLLLTELLLLRRSTYAAAAAGAAAIGMRQTNAVWVTFLTGAAILRDVLPERMAAAAAGSAAVQGDAAGDIADSIDSSSKQISSYKQIATPTQQQQQRHLRKLITSTFRELQDILGNVWRLKFSLLTQYCLLLVLPVAFAAFVVWNGGITLGDREAHAPASHLMQPLYFALFCLASAAPVLLQPAIVSRIQAGLAAEPVPSTLAVGIAAATAALCVRRYSLVHPYLVADNRHYTFYLWRKVFGRGELVRLAAVPGYVAGWLLLLAGLSVTEHWLWLAAFVASCWVTLAPAWLIEFRYFTTAFALAMLHLPVPPRSLSLLTAAGYCCVNALILWVFAKRPYTWGDGCVARFMW